MQPQPQTCGAPFHAVTDRIFHPGALRLPVTRLFAITDLCDVHPLPVDIAGERHQTALDASIVAFEHFTYRQVERAENREEGLRDDMVWDVLTELPLRRR